MPEPEKTGDNPKEEVVDNPVTEPATTPEGTAPAAEGQAPGGGAPPEESFYTGDPNTLPPELRDTHNKMLTDYRQKTAKVAEERRENAEEKQANGQNAEKAKLYDEFSKDQDFIDYWTKKRNGAATPQATAEPAKEPEITDDEWYAAQQSKEGQAKLMKKMFDQHASPIREELKTERGRRKFLEATQTINTFAYERDPSGKLLREDYSQLDDEGLIKMFMDQDPAKNDNEYSPKLSNAYSKAKAFWKKIKMEGASEILAQAKKKSESSSEPPTQSAQSSYSGPDPKKLSTAEAWALAERGITVPQD